MGMLRKRRNPTFLYIVVAKVHTEHISYEVETMLTAHNIAEAKKIAPGLVMYLERHSSMRPVGYQGRLDISDVQVRRKYQHRLK